MPLHDRSTSWGLVPDGLGYLRSWLAHISHGWRGLDPMGLATISTYAGLVAFVEGPTSMPQNAMAFDIASKLPGTAAQAMLYGWLLSYKERVSWWSYVQLVAAETQGAVADPLSGRSSVLEPAPGRQKKARSDSSICSIQTLG